MSKFILAILFFIVASYPYGNVSADTENFNTDYKELKKNCNGSSCCLASLDDMKQIGGFLMKEGGCPSGYQPNRLWCIDSYEWCEPIFEANRESGKDVVPNHKKQKNVRCPMDAKLCPDGSAVGRVPPDCKFAPCQGEEKEPRDSPSMTECEKAGGGIQLTEECDGSKNEWCVISPQEECYADQVVNGRCSVGEYSEELQGMVGITPWVLCDKDQ